MLNLLRRLIFWLACDHRDCVLEAIDRDWLFWRPLGNYYCARCGRRWSRLLLPDDQP